jgi:hypothetical protein
MGNTTLATFHSRQASEDDRYSQRRNPIPPPSTAPPHDGRRYDPTDRSVKDKASLSLALLHDNTFPRRRLLESSWSRAPRLGESRGLVKRRPPATISRRGLAAPFPLLASTPRQWPVVIRRRRLQRSTDMDPPPTDFFPLDTHPYSAAHLDPDLLPPWPPPFRISFPRPSAFHRGPRR